MQITSLDCFIFERYEDLRISSQSLSPNAFVSIGANVINPFASDFCKCVWQSGFSFSCHFGLDPFITKWEEFDYRIIASKSMS